ncbi:uncharacterized protein [Aristolochia californica]|uniref:uncharacterized protein n=1 Tax=Aristolochia californica TaxID=171875 RepID=UPI0035DF5FC4
MGLSCLTCQGLQRTDSGPTLEPLDNHFENLSSGTPRKRSGCLGCDPRERLRKGSSFASSSSSSSSLSSSKAPRKTLRKFATSATANMKEHAAAAVGLEQPRLVRSSGMRRDWSFEDLQKKFQVVNMQLPIK